MTGNLESEEGQPPETKTERREKKKQKRWAKMLQHGKSLAKVYRDVVRKQASK